MTWWIAFIIAVLGWYFTATQNAKNSTRSLINQEIKEARAKLHELIVACSSDDCQLPLKTNNQDFVKMQTYIVSVQELDRLYTSYCNSSFMQIRIVSICAALCTKVLQYKYLSKIKEFVQHWCSPLSIGTSSDNYFEVSEHAYTVRQSLTSDEDSIDEDMRLKVLNLEYKKLCLSYQFVS